MNIQKTITNCDLYGFVRQRKNNTFVVSDCPICGYRVCRCSSRSSSKTNVVILDLDDSHDFL